MNTTSNPWSTYEAALTSLSKGGQELDAPTLVLKLRKAFPDCDPNELNLAVETFVARHQAAEKLGEWARSGFFSLNLLQQASRESIAAYRAQFFSGCSHVLEIGTGTGSDTAALARVARSVTTIDADSIASELARRNLSLLGLNNVTFLVGDAQELVSRINGFDALFADPARRTKTGERLKSPDDYSPSLSFLLSLPVGFLRAIKISPGLFVEPCPAGWIRQFVGYGDECLEQTLWFGSSLIDSSIVVTDSSERWAPATDYPKLPIADDVSGYLIEAHAALNRSMRLREFFYEKGIKLFDPDVVYGVTADRPAPSKLISTYRVIEQLPYSQKNLKAVLTRLSWSNRTEFKKRNFPSDIENIRAQLKLPKHTHTSPYGVVFLFRYHGKPWAVLAERVYD